MCAQQTVERGEMRREVGNVGFDVSRGKRAQEHARDIEFLGQKDEGKL